MKPVSALLVSCLFLACGAVNDSSNKTIDAAPGVDTPSVPDASLGPDADLSGEATVTTKAAVTGQTLNTPIADVNLISLLPNGAPHATGKTDATGSATIKVYPGGTVTAVYRHTGTDMGADLFTFVGVKPGDNLEFGQRSLPPIGTSMNLGSQTYSWPASLNAAVTTYRVQTSCSSTTVAVPGLSSSALPELSSCNKTPMRILYTAITGSPSTLAGCGVRSTTFSNGANVALGSWTNSVAGSGNLSGLPTSITGLSVSLRAIVGGTTELPLTGGGFASGVPSGGAFTGNFQWCPNLGERTIARTSLGRPDFGSIVVMDSLPAAATSVTVASPMLPPWVEGTALVSAYRRQIQWVLANDGTNAHDAVYLALFFQQQANPNGFAEWHIVMPPNTQSVDLPKLPPEFDDLQPTLELGFGLDRLVAIEVPSVSSYDELRAMSFGFVICPECAIRANEVPRVITSGF